MELSIILIPFSDGDEWMNAKDCFFLFPFRLLWINDHNSFDPPSDEFAILGDWDY